MKNPTANWQASIYRAALFAAAFLASIGNVLSAQDYPNRPVRLIVTNSPGSAADVLARIVGAKLSQAWGQTVVIDNRTGANGMIGMDAVAKAVPDGYTLGLAAPSTLAVNQFIYKKIPYRPLEDLVPITQTTSIVIALVTNPGMPFKNVQGLIAFGKQKPGGLSYGSAGVGNLGHLAGELFAARAGLKMLHIPNRGDQPALLDLMTGQTELVFATLIAAAPHIRSGKLSLLAVCGTARDPGFPDAPTVAEAGVSGVFIEGWTGLVAPAKTPRAIVNRIQQEVARALADPKVKDSLSSQGGNVVASTPEAFQKFVRAEAAKWSKVIADSGIQFNEP